MCGVALDGFEKNDISIPKTDIHIYEFKCKQVQREEPYNDDDMAKLLDDLSKRLGQHYKSLFSIFTFIRKGGIMYIDWR